MGKLAVSREGTPPKAPLPILRAFPHFASPVAGVDFRPLLSKMPSLNPLVNLRIHTPKHVFQPIAEQNVKRLIHSNIASTSEVLVRQLLTTWEGT